MVADLSPAPLDVGFVEELKVQCPMFGFLGLLIQKRSVESRKQPAKSLRNRSPGIAM